MSQVKKGPGGPQCALSPCYPVEALRCEPRPVWQVARTCWWDFRCQEVRACVMGRRLPGLGPLVQSLTPVCAHSSCAERDEWHGCLSRALPEDYKAQALAAFHHSVEVSGGPGTPATCLGRLAVLCIRALAPPPTYLPLLPYSHRLRAATVQPQPGAQHLPLAVSNPRSASWRIQDGEGEATELECTLSHTPIQLVS